MIYFHQAVCFGFSPSMLHPSAFQEERELYTAYVSACSMPEFEALDCFLPEEEALRREILSLLRRSGKALHYNAPVVFQQDGPYNPCGDTAEIREQAFSLMRRHLDYAAEAGSPLMVVTGCADRGEDQRPELKKRYGEYFLRVCEYAKQYRIQILLEPLERRRFKKLLWGPTAECAAFIRDMRAQGADNGGLMMDTAHLPLMEETMGEAIDACAEVGFAHVHLGDAVFDEKSPFYGHTHPPLGVRGSLFTQEDLEAQFSLLISCGYLGGDKARGRVSLEVRPYPGVSERTSIRAMYEKCAAAFGAAAERAGL